MQTKIRRDKKYLFFILCVIGLGLISGILYYNFLDDVVKESIVTSLNNFNSFQYNFILKDLIIMSLLIVLSFFVIGLPLSVLYLFYEGFSISFLISIFFATFKIKGLLYIIIYILINKVLTLILLVIFIRKIINISRFIVGFILYKKETILLDKIVINFKNAIYIILFVLILNILLYFITPYIFSSLAFLIK